SKILILHAHEIGTFCIDCTGTPAPKEVAGPIRGQHDLAPPDIDPVNLALLDVIQDRARTPALIRGGCGPQPPGPHELAATNPSQLAVYLPRHVLPSFSMPGLCGWRPAPLLREHRAPSALFPCRVCSYLFLPPGNRKSCAIVGRCVTQRG